MKKIYRLAPLALTLAAGSSLAQEEDVARLQQQVDALQQQINSFSTDRVRFNGFLSTGYARASNNAGYAGIDDNTNVFDLSLMAIQASFSLTDKVQAVMQIVGRGLEDWDPSMEWAYLSYRATNDLQLRAGKMRQPLFMYSDSLELGYSQPWARAPVAVYGRGDQNFVGADAIHTYQLDNSALTSQLFAGYVDDVAAGTTVNVRNSLGLSVSWTDYVWTFRGVIAGGDLTLEGLPPFWPAVEDETSHYAGIGLSYDDGRWQIISEATRTEVDGFYTNFDAAYLSVGHRFGAYTPYVLVGWTESQDDDKRPAALFGPALNVKRMDYSLGVRWDVISGVALKADWTHARGFEEGPTGLDVQRVLGEGIDSTNVYTFKIDAAF